MRVAVTSKSFSRHEQLIEELKIVFPNVKLNLATKKLEDNEVIEFLSDCDAAIVALEEMNEYVIDKLPNLKAISKFGVGLDNIDIEYCLKKGIPVGWEKGVNRFSVAEMTLGYMLMLIRNLYTTSNLLSQNTWNKDGGMSLYRKTIGIIGVGHIGKELINLLKPFNCNILVNDIINQEEYYTNNNLTEVSKDEIFKKCDIVTIHTPYNKETHHLINKKSLEKMKPSAFVINSARGDIVNLDDLHKAIKENIIAGAAIDVYDKEPPTHPILKEQNVICTPHIGGNSKEAVLSMGRSAIKKLKEILDDQQ